LSNTPLLVTPAGGFSGTATMTCTSPVVYVTCVVTPTTVTLAGGVATQATAIITVSPSVSALGDRPLAPKNLTWLAIVLPLGMIGLARRNRITGKGVLLMVMLTLAAGATSCSSGTPVKLPPAGTQVVTVTGTGSGVVSSVQISVMVTN
jgi:hypothetical protein